VAGHFAKNFTFEGVDDPRVIEADSVKAWRIDESQEYGPTLVVNAGEIELFEILEVTVDLNYKPEEMLDKDEVYLVFSIDGDGKNLRYESIDLTAPQGGWKQQQLVSRMSAAISETAQVKVYVWNLKRKKLLMESLKVNINSY